MEMYVLWEGFGKYMSLKEGFRDLFMSVGGVMEMYVLWEELGKYMSLWERLKDIFMSVGGVLEMYVLWEELRDLCLWEGLE